MTSKPDSNEPGPGLTAREWVSLWLRGELAQYHRLMRELEVCKAEKDCLGVAGDRVNDLFEAAKEQGRKDPEFGWRCLNAARRILQTERKDEHIARARSLLYEVAEKDEIPAWRRKSIVANLAQPGKPDTPRESLSDWELLVSEKILDEHYDNVYQKVRMVRASLSWLTLAAFCIFVVVIWTAPGLGLFDKLNSPAGPRLTAFSFILFGVAGAVVSGFTRTKGLSKTRIPFQMAESLVMMGRLALGGLSGLAVAAAHAAGLIGGNTPVYLTAIVLAFASGFSERILVSALSPAERPS